MSKLSPKEKITGKLAAAQEEFLKSQLGLLPDDLTQEQIDGLDAALFEEEEVDEANGVRVGATEVVHPFFE